MLMYSLLDYSSSCSDTTGSLWFYSKDESTTFNGDIAYNNNNFKSFEYKGNLFRNTVDDGNNGILKNAKISIPLKT